MRRILTLIIAVITLFIFQTKTEAVMNFSLDEPRPGLAGNSMGDIVYDGEYIWVGTGDGLSYSSDSGKTWFTYDNTNGLNENDISALTVFDSTLWVACAYSRMIQGEPIPFGKGFNKTTNRGKYWEPHTPKQVDFAGEIAYDIAFDDSTVWAACWYGGLIHSRITQDTLGNDTLIWENVFVSDAAREDYEAERYQHLDNRFFSVVVDTFCPHDKKLKNSINDIIYDGRFLWVGTQNGLQVTENEGDTWLTFDTSNGLNANGVYSLTGYTSFSDDDTTSFLCVGVYSGEKEYELPLLPTLKGEGFNYTSDYGASWDTSQPAQADTLEKFAYDIAIIDTVVWAACGRGGLIRSFDRGETWGNVFVDTSAERRFQEDQLEQEDIFTSLGVDTFALDTTTLWAGTRNGVYKVIFTASDSADTVFRYLYQDTGEPFEVVCVGIQRYDNYTTVWASGCSLKSFGPWPPADPCDYITYNSTDGGETWNSYLEGIHVRDFAFSDFTVWAATEEGLKKTRDGGIIWDNFEILDTLGQKIIPSDFTSVCIVDSTIWAGTVDGLVKSTNDGKTWQVIKFTQSFKKAIWAGTAAGIFKFIYNYRDDFDTVLNYNSYDHGISGDFVVSTAIQKYNDKKIIWAGTQPAYSGGNGASKSTDDGDSWSVKLGGDRVWNFAFDDSVVWAATSSGLKRSSDGGESWDVFNYMKDKDEITENAIFSTEFTSVAIIDDEVWAGNAGGLVKAPKDVEVGEDTVWNVFRTFVPIGTEGSETAYAYPSPFSPMLSTGGVVWIHYRPQKDGPVTIKIYDFAMNLVITLLDEVSSAGRDQDTDWDGRNEKKDIVANGVYFFKVEAPEGQTEWGKLVVLK